MKKSIIFGILGFALILVAFTGVAAAVGESITVEITSSPSYADVEFVSGGHVYDVGTTPYSYTISSSSNPAQYPKTGTFYISKDGYETKTVSLTEDDWDGVAEGTHKTLYYSITLPAVAKGTVDIQSSPSGASIKIDGVYYGVTPLVVSLTTGKHTVTLSKSGYSTYSTSVSVHSGSVSYIDATLASSSGYIYVSSYPKGASVYIDQVYVGQTDNTFATSAGSHSVTITKAGYGSFGTKVTVNPGQVSTVTATLPESSEKGYANVASNPAGASVYVDGAYVGVTPKSGYLEVGPYSTSGYHSLQLRLSGYQTYTTSFETSTSSTPVIVATLVPDKSTTGTIHVTSSPVGAAVTVDGTYYGTTPVSVPNLAPGSHTVKVSAAGYIDNIQTINVNAGQYVELPVTLYTVSPTSASPAPILGVLVGLAAAGVFCALRRRQ